MKDHEHHAHGHGGGHAGGHDHEHMIADFRRRFWVSLALTVPVVVISPMTQHMFRIGHALSFPGDRYVLLILSSVIFFYGGQPFLRGLFDELRKWRPGMMTLIALAISVAYFYSAAVVLGLPGEDFFWELATLIDIMLLGHWIEMRSVLGASRALEDCPHALGLAVPLVVAGSTALSATHGLLIRDRSAFERARALGAVIFDKTGTLTSSL